MWVGSIWSSEGPNRIKRWRKGKLSLHLSWDTHLLLPSDIGASDSLAFRLRSWFTQTAPHSQASGPGLNYTTGRPVLRLADGRSKDFGTSIATWANSYNKSPLYIHVPTPVSTSISISPTVRFLWKTFTNTAFLPACVKSLSKLNCQNQNSSIHSAPKYFHPLPFQIFFLRYWQYHSKWHKHLVYCWRLEVSWCDTGAPSWRAALVFVIFQKQAPRENSKSLAILSPAVLEPQYSIHMADRQIMSVICFKYIGDFLPSKYNTAFFISGPAGSSPFLIQQSHLCAHSLSFLTFLRHNKLFLTFTGDFIHRILPGSFHS